MAQDPPDDSDTEGDDSASMEPFETDSLADPEGRVLDPSELDFSERDEVSDLGEGRFIVSAGSDGGPGDVSDPAGAVPSPSESSPRTPAPTEQGAVGADGADEASNAGNGSRDAVEDTDEANAAPPPDSASEGDRSRRPNSREPVESEPVDGEAVSEWLTESMTDNGFDYGFDATLKHDGEVMRHRMDSTEAEATFETLLLWYARQVDDDRPVEETLGRLLADSEVPVTFPPDALVTMLCHHGLSRDDTIDDLLGAVKRDGGLQLSTR
ncbi:hypothetical protein ACFO0N_19635 [Halobium salinum]|uniref:Uncharacterized protein n=1 Tax=Halobium salinum TaxID=1364940 RepID=A0ABD5PGY7_9EURY|nr:hypothetical protein [Halobium salinum]